MKIQDDLHDVWIENPWLHFQKTLNLKNYDKVAILTDENTEYYCLPYFKENASVSPTVFINIKSGEKEKNLETSRLIWEQMYKSGMGRNSLLLNLGGGVISDIGGFCAQNYFRGIDFYHIPTTLLAMVDASLGGKTGIDLMYGKNVIGSFSMPRGVIIDPEFLKTLPGEQLVAGLAEVLKHAIITDLDLFDWIATLPNIEKLNTEELKYMISRAVEIKMNIVRQDPYETGTERRRLNFGHTAGHALESYFLKSGKELLHGVAVSAGMVVESYLAYRLDLLPEIEMLKIANSIRNIFPVVDIRGLQPDEIAYFIQRDKKNQHGTLLFCLPDRIGSVRTEIIMEDAKMLEASFEFYYQFMLTE